MKRKEGSAMEAAMEKKVRRREEKRSRRNALVCNSRPEESAVLLGKLEDEGRKRFLDNPLSSRRDEPVFDARIFF